MDRAQKERLADEIFRSQPDMLASVLVLHRMKVPMEKMAFALEMLFVCFLAMRASGLAWPLITEDFQRRATLDPPAATDCRLSCLHWGGADAGCIRSCQSPRQPP